MYTDSLVHDENALKYLVTTIGEDNVVLGTDYPFPLGELHPGKLIESIQDWPNSTKVLTDKALIKCSSISMCVCVCVFLGEASWAECNEIART